MPLGPDADLSSVPQSPIHRLDCSQTGMEEHQAAVLLQAEGCPPYPHFASAEVKALLNNGYFVKISLLVLSQRLSIKLLKCGSFVVVPFSVDYFLLLSIVHIEHLHFPLNRVPCVFDFK